MTLRATLPPPHDQEPGPVSGAQLSQDIGDIRVVRRDVDTDDDDVGSPGDLWDPGQPQGETQGQVQDQEEQQQWGATREAKGNIRS